MDINKLSLKAFYEANKDAYISARHSGDAKKWDEAYKWDIFPKTNKEFTKFGTIDKENIAEIVALLQKNNPSQGSFAHWIDMDDLKILTEKPNGYQIIDKVWARKPEGIAEVIDNANAIADFLLHKKFSPSTYGYIMASQNCDNFAIFIDKVYKKIAELNYVERPGSLSQGAKYQMFNNSALYIGELMSEQKAEYQDMDWHQALNGQDFLYVTLQYPAAK